MKKMYRLVFFCFILSSIKYIEAKSSYKILVVVGRFPPYSGTAVLNQITGLIDRGHDVYIYSKKKGETKYAHPNMFKYKLYDRAYYHSSANENNKLKRGGLQNLPPDLETFDIIYSQFGCHSTEFLRVYKKRKLKAKLVTCFRGSDISKHVKENPHRYDKLLSKGDLFLPVCDYFRKRLIQLGGNPNKIIVHHSAIDVDKFSFKSRSLKHPNDTIHIVSVCRLVKKKGLSYAIRAVARLVKKYPNLRYTIVGFGGEEKNLERLVKQLNAQKNIKLVGRYSEDQIAKLLDRTHIFLQPSVTSEQGDQEGIPNAAKEAMACGLPVISTYHSGIPELIQDGVSGLLAPEHDVDGLVKKNKIPYQSSKAMAKNGARRP